MTLIPKFLLNMRRLSGMTSLHHLLNLETLDISHNEVDSLKRM